MVENLGVLMSVTKVTIVNNGYGFQAGDIVVESIRGSRWHKLARLLWRPRLKFADEVTACGFTVRERSMTWEEWRKAIRQAVIG